jgi:hypothetical protein
LELGLAVMMEPFEGMGEMEGDGMMAAVRDLLLSWLLSDPEGDSFGDALAGTDRPLTMLDLLTVRSSRAACSIQWSRRNERDELKRREPEKICNCREPQAAMSIQAPSCS